jgi:copper transport protein
VPRGAGAGPGATPRRKILAWSGRTLALLLLVVVAGEAKEVPRHTELESGVPGPGSSVEGPVGDLLLRFTTAVQLPLSAVRLLDGTGSGVPGTLEGVASSGGQEIRFTPNAPLRSGRYRVEWQTAGPDSHVIRGEYGFVVQGPPEGAGGGSPPGQPPGPAMEAGGAEVSGPGAPDATPGATTPSPVTHAIRWLQYLGTILVLGAVAFRLGVLPRLLRESTLSAAVPPMLARLGVLVGVGAFLLAVSLPGRLWSQSLSLWGTESMGPRNLGILVFQTPWGWGWLLQGVALLVVLLGLRLAAPGGSRERGWGVVGVAALLLAFVPALSGHAWGIEPRLVGVLLSGSHVMGAGVWLGGLAALLLAGVPGLRAMRGSDGALPGLASLVNAFSRMALVAVVVLVVAGVGQNIFLLGSPGNLVSTPWGRTLLIKLGLLAGAGALGLYNWRVVRPALKDSPRAGLLRIPASVELLLGLCVLAATAVLVSLSAP